MTELRIGTRPSPLARWQAELVAGSLAGRGVRSRLVAIESDGDIHVDAPLSSFQDEALFTGTIDAALRSGDIDLAVHSLKDLPLALPPDLAVVAVGTREDPREALVGRTGLRWADLPPGATIATSSTRRRAQLLHARPDLLIDDLRGAIGARVSQLEIRPDWDGLLLATAGLVRLGLGHRIGERVPETLILPAAGQAAIAVSIRVGDRIVGALVREAFDHVPTHLAVAAERAAAAALEAETDHPVAALGRIEPMPAGWRLALTARIIEPDGRWAKSRSVVAPVRSRSEAARVGRQLATGLLGETSTMRDADSRCATSS